MDREITRRDVLIVVLIIGFLKGFIWFSNYQYNKGYATALQDVIEKMQTPARVPEREL